MRNDSRWRNRAIGLVGLLAVLLWCGAHFRANNPIYQGIGTDNGIFLCMGRGMVEGLTPYVDITENKGPLFFLLMALPQLLAEGTAGVYALEVLLLLCNCFMLTLWARWLMRERFHPLCPVLMVLAYLCTRTKDSNFSEEYNLFFMLLGVTVLLHAYTGRKRGAGWRAFALGVCTAGIALVKLSDMPGLCVVLLAYLIYVCGGGYKPWRELARYAAGMALVAVPVFAYLWRVGAVGAMFTEYLLNNFTHTVVGKNYGFWKVRAYLFFGGYGWISLQPVLWALAAVALRVILRRRLCRQPHEAALLVFLVGFAAANLFTGYISGTGFVQHLLMGAATSMLAIGLILDAAFQLGMGRLPAADWAASAVALALCVVVGAQNALLLTPAQIQLAQERLEERREQETELSDYIEPDDSVYAIGIPGDWFWFNHVQPAFPCYNIIGFIVDHVGMDRAKQFEDFMIQNTPDILVIDGDSEKYRGVLTNETLDFIGENYYIEVEDSKGRRLMRTIW